MEKIKFETYMSYSYLNLLRKNHPAWKLLTSHQAPFIAAFFYMTFLKNKQREISEEKLISYLENFIENINYEDKASFTPQEILTQWSNIEYGFLRKYYPKDKDEIHYDLTPAAQKAVEYLMSFEQRNFMATESRLMIIFDLLKNIIEKSNENPEFRIQELEKQKREIEKEIEEIKEGKIELLSPAQIKERFLQVMNLSYDIVSDFRIVEQHFRDLEKNLRKKILTFDSGKGELLSDYFKEENSIEKSEQGRSFNAFWKFLASKSSKENFKTLIEKALSLKEIIEIPGSLNIERIENDWMKGSEHVLDTIALLSKQLSFFVSESSYIEEKRISELIKSIETNALQLDGENLDGENYKNFIGIKSWYADIDFPMYKKLYSIPNKILLDNSPIENQEEDVDFSPLYLQFFMDRKKLEERINHLLLDKEEISLKEIIDIYPLKGGLTELLTYLVLVKEGINSEIDYNNSFEVTWTYKNGDSQSAKLPFIIFKNLKNNEFESDRDE